ncbi:MAG: cytidylate kinase [Candidatus Pacebacteria bacterium CG_4_10_14_3_um_filter_34_15]|nr:(d)CMP kinase [Candidatus Pacearchaeota archaeon]NCQ65596.1 (d)CMP kinase [Candidatus Paceibacterota bacterium]OIO43825.1 MAG: cytidylate kinase [Candidatus Pacebacteria bacterium CG1_02_43_31]PIQ80741.1 MAG: cytidylate kinase [Candidatus Pacebacteria bacterium CG11_big_fil_rev_8_21_14_0_20_34_55]PIX81964.1 MAG: cytidylate kinase [Candidatus Pacebacteria bacterium CG_4_10_14_3_um_filter_34_15]PJC43427.1 MAG: cytidylate kinase [Candidatus Pacebacteria bacterium CG_4_9_14_0_2_um_filter_34_50]
MNNFFHIAIDGPVAAGKGTVSRIIAERLNFLYIDTGAMYRVAALLTIKNNLKFDNEDALVALLEKSEIKMNNPVGLEKDGRLTTVIVNDKDVSWKIRTEEVGRGASIVGQISEVRKILVKKQQEIAQSKNVVMEGRDITYKVLPDANLKIYLTGKDFVRANRRHMQLQSRGVDISFNQVYVDLVSRDKIDMERTTDPLKIVDDAWVIDTSDLSIEQVVNLIVFKVNVMQEALSAN